MCNVQFRGCANHLVVGEGEERLGQQVDLALHQADRKGGAEEGVYK